MVKIVSLTPHPSIVKECICQKCGALLQYLPLDIKNRTCKDYDGSSDIYYYIICPNCKNEIMVK